MRQYSIRPCKVVERGADGREYIDSTVDASEAEFWGVYEVQPEGTEMWLADHPTRERAEQHVERLGGGNENQ